MVGTFHRECTMKSRSEIFLVLALSLAAGCQDYDPPEEANPFDSIAPAPATQPAVPGADEPGSTYEP